MSKLYYVGKKFGAKSLDIIDQAEAICEEYAAQGFDLTLRQLYYQFVSRDLIANKQSEYKRLGGIINDARLAGMLDWDYIVDRTRNVQSLSHWDRPSGVINAAARSYHRDLWADQPKRVEVWIEKDALAGVIEPTCRDLDVAYFSCRGYTSQSEMWSAAQRLREYTVAGQEVVILHLGDHDPSGIDMSRDIQDRLNTFATGDAVRQFMDDYEGERGIDFADRNPDDWKDYAIRRLRETSKPRLKRIALTMDQIEQYNPPPNPAKSTDARYESYLLEHGDESWELDALDPTTLAALIRDEVEALTDEDLMEAAREREAEERQTITVAASRWSEVQEFLDAQPEEVTT